MMRPEKIGVVALGLLLVLALAVPAQAQVTAGTINAKQAGTWNITNISGTITGTYAQGSTTSGQSGALIQGAVTTAAPSYTTAQTSPLSLDTSGRLRADVSSWLGSTAPSVGQKAMASSVPVVISSDQSTISVTAGAQSAVGSFQTSVTTTEAALATNTTKNVCLKAATANTAAIYVGTTGVTSSTGYELNAGDGICLPVSNSNLAHAVAASGTQTLTTAFTN